MDGETIIAQGLHVIFTMTKYSISHRLETGAAEAGVKRIGLHELRHPNVKFKPKFIFAFDQT